jgi:superfamily II DNA or RNA helicase
MEVKIGSIIKAPGWKEPVEVKLFEKINNSYCKILGRFIYSNELFERTLNINELKTTEINSILIDFSSNSEDVFLALENIRYRYTALYDPLLAVNTSKVDPLPHQIEAVYGYVLKLPRIRFLIADDPGAGKTIMAGLIIKELKIRGLVDRILIVTPGHLKDQWRRELKERFEEKFTVVDRTFMDSKYGENVWDTEKQIITSIDFAKQDNIRKTLEFTHFDLVIIDEAHKLSAYQYGNKTSKSKRYRLGEILSNISENMLFLTATPHKGDSENFRLFLDLLEPGFFATSDILKQSITNKENPLFLRRLKEDLKNFEGEPLFLPRNVKTIVYSIQKDSPNEVQLYNKLSEYVHNQYNKAMSNDQQKRNIAFALVILQRRFASSVYALYKSFERRKKRLEDLYKEVEQSKYNDNHSTLIDLDEIDDVTEEEKWKKEELLLTLSTAENKQELRNEIAIIDELLLIAKNIIENEDEIKLRELKSTMNKLNVNFPGRKIIIFTESKDTLEYLEKKIQKWGYSVCTIHGGMKLEERITMEKIFKNDKQVLIATEAAGEGINLQFCNLMINYDIPWNPNRLEQRMGRIHRYGQTKEVFIFNMVNKDTREGTVLKRLFEKLEEIRNALGSDKVFDVISEIFEERKLSQLLIDAAVNARSQEEILKEIDVKIDDEYIKRVKDNMGDTLATRFIDYTRIRELRDKALEYKLIPEYTENYFLKAFEKAGGKYSKRRDGFINIESVPYDLKQISRDENFIKKYGQVFSSYRKVTFDKETAFKNPDSEFISFGHPLFEAVLKWVEKTYTDSLKKGAVFIDPDGKLDGTLLFYDAEVIDGKNNIVGKRLFTFFIDSSLNNIKEVNPSIIWDLAFSKNHLNCSIDIENIKSKVSPILLEIVEKYKNDLQKERDRQTAIKEKYGVKSLLTLIKKLDNDLAELYIRKSEKHENVDLAIRNKEERKRKYEEALKKLSENILHERCLQIGTYNFIGAVKVIPKNLLLETNDEMVRDDYIEKIGMDIAIEYEKGNGRIPEDVSSENLGFDIRSKVKKGDEYFIDRYIEVKARAREGKIVLTQNEWFKAQRFKDKYYLYVVLNAVTNPELIIIQNPVENVQAEKKVEVVRYIIPLSEIKKS